jgi:hypothetical protein
MSNIEPEDYAEHAIDDPRVAAQHFRVMQLMTPEWQNSLSNDEPK